MKKTPHFFLFLTLALIVTACGGGDLTVKDAWARPALADNNSAIYFVIDNPTGENDTLLQVASNASGIAEMHMTMAVEGETNHAEHNMETMPQGEVMTMVKQENVPVPSRGEVAFAPGGLHVMLIGLNADLVAGDTIELTLTFEKAGTMTLQVPIEER
jgi:copper(I)-binding protein